MPAPRSVLRLIHWSAFLYLIVLTLLLELPSLPEEIAPLCETWAFSKHLAAFAILGFLVELGRSKGTMFFWVGVLIFYGIGTEVLQLLLHSLCNRFFAWEDILHNTLGVLLGTFIGHFCRPFVTSLQ